MFSTITSGLSLIGSLFVTINKDNGNVVVNIAPFIAVSLLFVSVGCAFSIDDESFSQCFTSSAMAIKEAFH